MKLRADKISTKYQLGISLIECIMVAGIATSLGAAGIPMINKYVANAGKDGSLADIHTSVLTARAAAINRSKNITVCATNNGSQCSAEASDWNHGWIVFEDDGTHSVTSPAQIINNQLRTSSGNTLTSTSELPFFTFGALGSVISSPRQLALRVHSNNNRSDSKCLVIVPPGRMSVVTTAKDPNNCPQMV